jgi:uncharacterized protein with HEPN domain
MTPRDREALGRMIECIDIVDGYVERGGATWTEDGMVVDAVAKRIEEIGEVAKRIAPETLASMPEVNWRGLKGIREVLAHDYDELDAEILAEVVRDKLPAVREAVDRVLRSG